MSKGQGGAKGRAGWPSKTGNPSGRGRDNASAVGPYGGSEGRSMPPPSLPTGDAVADGAAAFSRGEPATNNPYCEPASRREWEQGYMYESAWYYDE